MSKVYIVALSTEYEGDHPIAYFTNPQAAQQLIQAMQSDPEAFADSTIAFEMSKMDVRPPEIKEVDADLPMESLLKRPMSTPGDEHSQTPIGQMNMGDDQLTPGAVNQMGLEQMNSWVKRHCKFASAEGMGKAIEGGGAPVQGLHGQGQEAPH